MFSRKLLAAAIAGSLVGPTVVAADPIEFDFYGSLRLQLEHADPDGAGSYTGFRDAYSRLGFTASAPLAGGVGAFAQLEIPLDLANGKVQDPYNTGGEDIRIAKIGVNTQFGSFAYGRDWMPYYNAIAFPVDMFSSFQSGFATYAAFRVSDTLFYSSPDFSGFSFAAAYVTDGNSNAGDDNPYQLTGSYSMQDTVFSVGLQDASDDDSTRAWGLSAMHTMGGLYFGAKIEYITSDDDDIDGNTAANVFASYTQDQHTFKGMLATVDGFAGDVVHLGYDFQFRPNLLFFAEYYYEGEASGAIPAEKARDTKDGNIFQTIIDADSDGGSVFLIGARYDF